MASGTFSFLATALLACVALAACGDGANGKDGANGAPGTSMLVRTVAEPAGANCASGGQKVQLGADVNGNGRLDDDEVQETRYVCNGNSIAGPAGATGEKGAAGENAPETAPIGKFLATQIIKGAILACETVIQRDRSVTCFQPRVNGVILVELGMVREPSGLQAMNSLCKAVTGGNTSGYTTDPISPDDSFFSSWTEDGWHFSQNVIPGQLQVRQLGCFSTL
jgi:hypothetical protein